jgi:hypothetical protein
MILQERDKRSEWKTIRGLTARLAIPMEGNLALESESID